MSKLEEDKAILLEALNLIRGDAGCENYFIGACVTARPDGRLKEYTADSWCNSCIANEAIGRVTSD